MRVASPIDRVAAMTGILSFGWRFILIALVFAILFLAGSSIIPSAMLDLSASEPGLLGIGPGLLVVVLVEASMIALIVHSTRGHGWKLAVTLAVTYYGVTTIMTQIETWYFLSDLTVGPELLPYLFLMRLPACAITLPFAVWLLGRWTPTSGGTGASHAPMPAGEWAWKLVLAAAVYVALYWSAGYYIAWQNPALRAFYGRPGEPLPFGVQTLNTLRDAPGLLPFQFLRGMLWVVFLSPVIRGSRPGLWPTALITALLLSLPVNIGHILANPLIPIASVRFSHMIETASSNFVFGLVAARLFYPASKSARSAS
jgi:hypothetical protein